MPWVTVRTVSRDPLTGLDVNSSAFRQRSKRVQLSSDPDVATEQTVREMVSQINEAAGDPLVLACAHRAVQQFGGFAAASPRGMAEACYWWCKHYLKFRHHGDMFEVWSGDLGDPRTKLQLLIAPDVLVRMKRMEGDCAIYTMMVCAMLRALGLHYQVCPAAVDHSQPEIFTHVFARVVLPTGTESLDASHGQYPGWQVPQEDMLRLWVFDEHGQRVAGSGFTGLHAYRRSGMGADGADVAEGVDYIPPAGDNPTQTFGSDLDWSGIPQSPGGYSAPSQNSAQWAAFASNLAKMGFNLAQINSIQPGTVVSANGAILRQTPGYAVPVGSPISSALGGNTLLYAGIGLVGLFVIGSMLKK